MLLGIAKQVIPFCNNRELDEDKSASLPNKVNNSGKLSASGTQRKVAIKILNKSRIIKQETGLKNLINEIKVHWTLD